MAKLKLHIEHGGAVTTLYFPSLPVRIGRDVDSHCRLEFPWVSRRHARIDMLDGRLVLRDEGSRRGTWILGGTRALEPDEEVELASVGSCFAIGALNIRAEFDSGESVASEEPDADSPSAAAMATRGYDVSNVDPVALDAEAVERALLEALEEQQRALSHLDAVLGQAEACGAAHLARFAALVVREDAEWDGRATSRHFVTVSGIRPEPARPDAAALRALQEIAATYVPYGPPLTSVEAVVAFATRLDKALTLMLDAIAALRYALQRETGIVKPDPPQRGDLGAGLLDWTNDESVLDAVREELVRMIAHHRRFVDGAMLGLERILERLDPAAIQAAHGGQGVWRPWRRAAMWDDYERRFSALVRAKERALGPVFAGVQRAVEGYSRTVLEACGAPRAALQ